LKPFVRRTLIPFCCNVFFQKGEQRLNAILGSLDQEPDRQKAGEGKEKETLSADIISALPDDSPQSVGMDQAENQSGGHAEIQMMKIAPAERRVKQRPAVNRERKQQNDLSVDASPYPPSKKKEKGEEINQDGHVPERKNFSCCRKGPVTGKRIQLDHFYKIDVWNRGKSLGRIFGVDHQSLKNVRE